MFQPHPTPFSSSSSSFSAASYGDVPDFAAFQSTPLATGGPIILDQPTFAPTNYNLPLSTGASRRFPKMEMGLNHDLDAQEAAARNYQPDLQGPLVGEKKSTAALTEEYAKADAIYVAKTMALPEKYSHYRQILGDGNCGWRAAGFSYFELLARRSDKNQIDGEVARMMSLTNLITTMSGHEAWTFEDMRDETLELLKTVAASLHLGPAHTVSLILEAFNDAEKSNAIIYYFRLVASAWLRANAATYQGFIHDARGVDGYCKDYIDPPNTEIDHLGMTLLIDVLLKPVGVSVEIVYLDRSEGTQVNSHLFEADDSQVGLGANIGSYVAHLLYRPGHYDILYKESSNPAGIMSQPGNSSVPATLQINRATSLQGQRQLEATMNDMTQYSNIDISVLSNIPGLSFAPQSQSFPTTFSPVNSYDQMSGTSYGLPAEKANISPISPISAVSSVSPGSSIPAFPATALPIHSLPHPPTSPSPINTSGSISGIGGIHNQSHFRPSKYEYEAEWAESPQPQFQTSTFKNSHYNTAHYNNPNFQPEEWSPDCEEATGRKGK